MQNPCITNTTFESIKDLEVQSSSSETTNNDLALSSMGSSEGQQPVQGLNNDKGNSDNQKRFAQMRSAQKSQSDRSGNLDNLERDHDYEKQAALQEQQYLSNVLTNKERALLVLYKILHFAPMFATVNIILFMIITYGMVSIIKLTIFSCKTLLSIKIPTLTLYFPLYRRIYIPC